jgi:hypothetical protein
MFGQIGVTDDPDVGGWLVTEQFAGGGRYTRRASIFTGGSQPNQPLTFYS